MLICKRQQNGVERCWLREHFENKWMKSYKYKCRLDRQRDHFTPFIALSSFEEDITFRDNKLEGDGVHRYRSFLGGGGAKASAPPVFSAGLANFANANSICITDFMSVSRNWTCSRWREISGGRAGAGRFFFWIRHKIKEGGQCNPFPPQAVITLLWLCGNPLAIASLSNVLSLVDFFFTA